MIERVLSQKLIWGAKRPPGAEQHQFANEKTNQRNDKIMASFAKTFRQLHNKSQPLILPNAWDAGSARLFEDLGASAIATTSVVSAGPWAIRTKMRCRLLC